MLTSVFPRTGLLGTRPNHYSWTNHRNETTVLAGSYRKSAHVPVFLSLVSGHRQSTRQLPEAYETEWPCRGYHCKSAWFGFSCGGELWGAQQCLPNPGNSVPSPLWDSCVFVSVSVSGVYYLLGLCFRVVG